MSTEIDNKIVSLQQKVAEKKQQIKKAERPSWNTNCLFDCNGVKRNIQTIGTVREIVELFSSLLQAEDSFTTASLRLEAKEKFTTPSGYSVKEWEEDFKTRIAMINLSVERLKLRNLEEMLESLESDDLKRQKLLNKIEQELE